MGSSYRFLEINSGKIDLVKMILIPRLFNNHSFFDYDQEKFFKISRLNDNKNTNRKRFSIESYIMK